MALDAVRRSEQLALALVRRMVVECFTGRTPSGSPGQGAGIDEQRAAALVARLVADAVEEEREECAQIAEVLEPPGPETIAMLIRDRGLAS